MNLLPKRLPLGPGPFAASVFSGLMLTLAFPSASLWPLIFCGLVPLAVLAGESSSGTSFKAGWLTGLVHFGTLLYWLISVLVVYGHIPWALSLPIFLLMIAYLALYPALFAFGLNLAGQRLGVRPGGLLWISTGAALYTGLEYFKGFFLTGFPWEPLGAALAPALPLVQLADMAGTGGLTFLVAAVNLALAAMVLKYRTGDRGGVRGYAVPAAVAVCVLALMTGYGYLRLGGVEKEMSQAPENRVAVVQASIDQSVKWDPQYRLDTVTVYNDLTVRAAASHPDLIVWPETATPFFYLANESYSDWLNRLVRETGAPLLFGSPAYEEKDGETRYYNRAYLLDGRAELLGHYDKVHLVPYGEYVPLQRFFPFISKITEAVGNYYPGRKGKLLELDGEKLGVLICYESIFPELARKQVKAGASYLIVMTNDAWFGTSAAPYQHFEQAVLRAVENRRSVVRAANTGISGYILPSGRVEATLGLFKRDTVEKSVPSMIQKTIYTTVGDVVPLGSLGITVLIFAAVYIRRKKHAG